VTDDAVRACRVERLRLYRFRNYGDETVELGAGLTVISGRNAQGKTTLLEAIATLALTRSPRAASAAELISWGAETSQVQARIRRPEGPLALDMRLECARGRPLARDPESNIDDLLAPRATRVTHVDGKARPARALLGLCPVVLFWPDDLQLVKGGPDGRRRLLDVVLSQLDPRVAAELVRYRRILEQRNALLKQVRLGTAPRGALSGFDTALAHSGSVIQLARASLCAELQALAAPALEDLSRAGEQLQLEYQTAGGLITGDARTAAAAFEAALTERFQEELARGVTLVGPHRDEVAVLLDGRSARTTASQGQQRSIVLALKLAEVRHVHAMAGMAPVLLLDDVLSELDTARREGLLTGLGARSLNGQTLLTTTEDARLALPELGAVRRLHVEAGRVRDVPVQAERARA
jgi:DNA replication and repair protein RecF